MYSTSSNQGGSKRAMKILYRTISDPVTLLEKQSMKIEEFPLPEHILSTLQTNLDDSNMMLPVSARNLREWKAGLLDR